MIFSRAGAYAVRALLYLHSHRDDGPILSSVIAESENIPAPFLIKILGALSTSGIVNSTRGRKGGFWLNEGQDNLSLYAIANVFDNQTSRGTCIFGYGVCGDNDDCPIHKELSEPKERIRRYFDTTTLADLHRMMERVNAD